MPNGSMLPDRQSIQSYIFDRTKVILPAFLSLSTVFTVEGLSLKSMPFASSKSFLYKSKIVFWRQWFFHPVPVTVAKVAGGYNVVCGDASSLAVGDKVFPCTPHP